MKKLLLLLTGILLVAGLRSQSNVFSKVYYNGNVQGYSITQAYDNGFMIAGSVAGYAMIMKIDSAGNTSWIKYYGISNSNAFNCITKTSDNNFVAAGYGVFTGVTNQMAVAKINPQGDTIWSKLISTGTALYPSAIEQTYDHGFIISGTITVSAAPYSDIFIAKTDSSGTLQWMKSYVGGNNGNTANSVKQTPDSGYVVSATIENYPPYTKNAAVIKLTPSGTVQWANTYNELTAVPSAGDDLLATAGGIINYMDVENKKEIVKTDYSGNILWKKEYNSMGANQPCPNQCIHMGIKPTADGGFILSDGNYWGGVMTKTDSLANVQWSDMLYFNGTMAIPAKDSGYIALGNGPVWGKGPGVNSPQVGLIKVDSAGAGVLCVSGNNPYPYNDTLIATPLTLTVITTGSAVAFHPVINNSLVSMVDDCVDFLGGINENRNENEITLFPNPTTGSFEIRSTTKIQSIKVVNVLGCEILKQVQNDKSAIINLSDIPKGIYFVQVYFDKLSNLPMENKKIIIQ